MFQYLTQGSDRAHRQQRADHTRHASDLATVRKTLIRQGLLRQTRAVSTLPAPVPVAPNSPPPITVLSSGPCHCQADSENILRVLQYMLSEMEHKWAYSAPPEISISPPVMIHPPEAEILTDLTLLNARVRQIAETMASAESLRIFRTNTRSILDRHQALLETIQTTVSVRSETTTSPAHPVPPPPIPPAAITRLDIDYDRLSELIKEPIMRQVQSEASRARIQAQNRHQAYISRFDVIEQAVTNAHVTHSSVPVRTMQ